MLKMESFKGTVVETIFRNSDNGYTVALMETENEVLTITGVFGTDITNEILEVFGSIIKHPKYGEQFNVDIYNGIFFISALVIKSFNNRLLSLTSSPIIENL